jgi:hypothetical protein
MTDEQASEPMFNTGFWNEKLSEFIGECDGMSGGYRSVTTIVQEENRLLHGKHVKLTFEVLEWPPRTNDFFDEVRAELARARAKFPGGPLTTIALMEEVGELAKATIEESQERVYDEAVQVAVMAIRCAIDGDKSADEYRATLDLEPTGAQNATMQEWQP